MNVHCENAFSIVRTRTSAKILLSILLISRKQRGLKQDGVWNPLKSKTTTQTNAYRAPALLPLGKGMQGTLPGAGDGMTVRAIWCRGSVENWQNKNLNFSYIDLKQSISVNLKILGKEKGNVHIKALADSLRKKAAAIIAPCMEHIRE